MKNHFLLIFIIKLIIILFSNFLSAQSVSGYVIDKQSRQPIEGATVVLLSSQGNQFFDTKSDGFYIFEASPGTYTLSCNYRGYENYVIPNLRLNHNDFKSLDIELQKENLIDPQVPSHYIPQEDKTKMQRSIDQKPSAGSKKSVKENFGHAYQTLLQNKGQFRYGMKVGFNFADINQKFKNSKYEYDTKIMLGYQAGLCVDYVLNDVVSLESGLFYSIKGFSYDLEADLDKDETVSGFYRNILNYLELPVSLSYTTGKIKLSAGPYIAVMVSGKSKWDITYSYSPTDEEYHYKGNSDYKPVFGKVKKDFDYYNYYPIRAIDFGLNLGFGYNLQPFWITAGYNIGFGNHTPKETGSKPEVYLIRNRVLNLLVSYYF